MKKHCRVRGKGFTLVELLVVIAIIGILVAIVLPAVNNALFRGRLTATTVNGTNLVKALIARDTEQLYRSAASGWPRSGANEPENNRFVNSTDFFLFLVTTEVMNVTYSFFTAPGVPSAAEATEFEDRRNAWAIVADINDAYPETAPVLFTRNLDISRMDDGLTPDGSRRNVPNQLAPTGGDEMTTQPFAHRGLAMVTKGGAGFSLFRDDLQMQYFTNLFIRLDAQGGMLTNVVLRP